jgi:cephalosporin hydroxylase
LGRFRPNLQVHLVRALFGLHDGEARRFPVSEYASKTLPVAPVPIWQNTIEFENLLTFLDSRPPKRILEIGGFFGGTLWHWATRYRPEVLVEIDQPVPYGHEYWERVWESRALWSSWMEEGTDFHDLIGFSTDWEIWNQADQHKPYDFMFIDGDHAYEGVKKDFATYRPMLSPGGAIAFHDTQQHEPGVMRFSAELKTIYPWVEFYSPDWGAGILLVFP